MSVWLNTVQEEDTHIHTSALQLASRSHIWNFGKEPIYPSHYTCMRDILGIGGCASVEAVPFKVSSKHSRM